MLIPSPKQGYTADGTSLSRRVNANSQPMIVWVRSVNKLIKKGEC